MGAAIYLEEYAPDNWFTRIVQLNVSNLSGVPSVVYGLLGLGVFVTFFGFDFLGPSVLTGGLTLGLLVLPIIIIASQEALRAVPSSLREAAFALGGNPVAGDLASRAAGRDVGGSDRDDPRDRPGVGRDRADPRRRGGPLHHPRAQPPLDGYSPRRSRYSML